MRRIFALFVLVFLASSLSSQTAVDNQKKPLTIEALVAPGGLTGRGPENFQWSPDSTMLSFVQRDDTVYVIA